MHGGSLYLQEWLPDMTEGGGSVVAQPAHSLPSLPVVIAVAPVEAGSQAQGLALHGRSDALEDTVHGLQDSPKYRFKVTQTSWLIHTGGLKVDGTGGMVEWVA